MKRIFPITILIVLFIYSCTGTSSPTPDINSTPDARATTQITLQSLIATVNAQGTQIALLIQATETPVALLSQVTETPAAIGQTRWKFTDELDKGCEPIVDLNGGEASLTGKLLEVKLFFSDVPEKLVIDNHSIKNNTPDYSWSILIETEKSKYDLGVVNWKFAEETERSVNLSDALTWADKSLWVEKKTGNYDYATGSPEVMANFDPEQNSLNISVTYPDFSEKMILSARTKGINDKTDNDSGSFFPY